MQSGAIDMSGIGTIAKRLRAWARAAFTELTVLWLSLSDDRVGWPAKAIALLTLGYALSPIDLIPDFIPVLGQLDDLLIVPVGIFLALRLIPANVRAQLRVRAAENTGKPNIRRLYSVALIVGTWILFLLVLSWLVGWI